MRPLILASALFTLTLSAVCAENAPSEIPRGSQLRALLFDLARPKAEAEAGQPLKFHGSLKQLGDFAFFRGDIVDAKGRPISLYESESSEAFALWKRVNGDWKLMDVSVGVTDAFFYYVYPDQYGAPRILLE